MGIKDAGGFGLGFGYSLLLLVWKGAGTRFLFTTLGFGFK